MVGDLREGIADGFVFVSQCDGEVGFELLDQVIDDGGLETCKI